MGEAKKRGTFEKRKAEGVTRREAEQHERKRLRTEREKARLEEFREMTLAQRRRLASLSAISGGIEAYVMTSPRTRNQRS